ncbi:23S rRNA accumulation protein YceD [Agarivorans sp. MS3-6]|uniref:23S rRNA accumulation protein YceD n=1 Tax=Agarivorans sp. TSD2052 TaxID=2937286 RepID=UPI00200D72D2|nr:23S rRNA accumulation protein YceD [Agarivorans sp. TSD2052]UPW20604.1 23S rRNA accumulation protein YceD [Agarivorans sp. TSD2052]
MQKVKLPVEIDPFKTAKRKLDYQGLLEVIRLPRLNDAILKVNSDVDVWLRFGTDPQGLVVVQGRALTEVELECQRCNETFSFPIDVEFTYSPVCDESQIDELPEDYEPLQLDDDNYFVVAELIEDELLLSLPIIAKHPLEDCKVKQNEQVFGKIEVVEEESKPNPFAVLESLKKKD